MPIARLAMVRIIHKPIAISMRARNPRREITGCWRCSKPVTLRLFHGGFIQARAAPSIGPNQSKSRDAHGDIDAELTLDRKRLQGDRAIGAAHQNVRAAADDDG